jgi:hypothetical protein
MVGDGSVPAFAGNFPASFAPGAVVFGRETVAIPSAPLIPLDEDDLSPTVALLFNGFAPPTLVPNPTIPSSFVPFCSTSFLFPLSVLNPTLLLGLTGRGNDNFSSAIDKVDSVEAGLSGREGGGSLNGDPAEAFHAGLGFDGDVENDFDLLGEDGPVLGPELGRALEGVELDVGVDDEDEPTMKSFMDICFIFTLVFVVLLLSVTERPGALNVNVNDLRTPAASPISI